MLVASAVFAIASAIALVIYSAARRSHALGESLIDQQQSARLALDTMIADLRLAGFHVDPDGGRSGVDEPIEGAWDTAITVRADFDFGDAASADPEAFLPATPPGLVTTGNDEIVTYALAKPAPSGGDSLALEIDADRPRRGTARPVVIPALCLVHDDPPYTLYRITPAEFAGPFPAAPQARGDFLYEPVADDIHSLRFRYYADGGAPLGPDTPSDPADDLGGGDARAAARRLVRRIAVHLVGMAPRGDPRYVDAEDPHPATRHHRKFALRSEVHAENAGRPGIPAVRR
jgi:hypothetical protein